MRAWFIGIAALLCVLALPVQASAKFHYTHRISVTGGLEDNWTVADSGYCASQGAGSTTLDFSTNDHTRIRPFISKYGGRPHSNKMGLWVLGVPGGGGVTHLGSLKATGTLTHTDNTTQNPQEPGIEGPCQPADKSNCGALPIKKSSAHILSIDKKWIAVSIYVDGDLRSTRNCLSGALESWMFPRNVVGGGNKYGELRVKMPSASAFKRKHSITLTATSHQASSGPISDPPREIYTDDVTRHVAVTITKL